MKTGARILAVRVPWLFLVYLENDDHKKNIRDMIEIAFQDRGLFRKKGVRGWDPSRESGPVHFSRSRATGAAALPPPYPVPVPH